MKNMNSKKSTVGLVPATLILAGITLAFILLVNSQNQKATINKVGTPTVTEGEAAIKNTSDLDAASRELDKNDPDKIEAEIKPLSVELSNF